eukprot:SAG31_NODE_34516_length_332_cov_0.785408_1_plen_45_part_10
MLCTQPKQPHLVAAAAVPAAHSCHQELRRWLEVAAISGQLMRVPV